jgi:trehalose/maltose hydrolase-like predicted phosphorylase
MVGCSQLSDENTNRNNEELLLQHEIEVIQGMLESKSKYRKIVQAGIARWVKDFQDGRIEVRSVDDLRKLIEMDIELQKDDL